ncbi:MAG: transglycosylase domain-containing protein [Candidatus Saccharimonadia bacterium]
MFAKICGVGFLIVVLSFLYVAKDLPNPSAVRQITGAQNTKYYARDALDSNGNLKIKNGQIDGTLLWEDHGDQNRTVIDFSQMPATIKDATIAIEDKNFYKEGAFSFVAYLRAAVVDILHRGIYQGGSTITQQYVKNALLSDDQSFTRKIKELILSIEISSYYKKDDVLKLYLNEIPYGSQAYGIQAAAKTFFNENAEQLTLSQSAFLAAMANAPSYYSPYGENTDSLIARQHLVLDDMATQGYITDAQATAAKATDLSGFQPVPNIGGNVTAPQFDLYAKEVLESEYGTTEVESGGLKVITTLDPNKESLATAAIASNMRSIQYSGGSNAAIVSADPKTGQILAMVGSNDPINNPFNVALAGRQPGSSFKPFVYATAWSKGNNYGPGTTMYDVTTDFGGGYTPKDYDGLNHGIQSMRTALDNSYNIPAVKTLYMVGVSNALATAHRMGITTLNNPPGTYGLSLVLGSGEVKLNDMVNAYESFSNGGSHYAATPILQVYDVNGKKLQDNSKPPSTSVLDPQVAYLMNNVLSDNNARAAAFGLNNPLTVSGHTVAAKTGTTTNFKDAWTIGYTPDLVTGVWVGNNDDTSMNAEAVDIAAPVWHTFMTSALKGVPNDQFSKPAGIQTLTLDGDTGRAVTSATKHPRTDIFAAWYKVPAADSTQSAKIDKVSNLLATACTPPLAVETVYSSEIHAEIPSTDPSFALWDPPVEALARTLGFNAGGGVLPTQSDNVHNCSDTKPSVTLIVNGSGPLQITAQVNSGTFQANQLDIMFDDQTISTQSPIAQNPYTFTYNAPTTGSHTITATVTDTGLYQASDQQTVLVTNAGGATFSGNLPANNSHVPLGFVSFQWDAYPGASKYTLYYRNGSGAYTKVDNIGSNASNVAGITSGSYTWYVEAYSQATLDATTSVNTFVAP